jgi:uncharacterized protein (DUF4415 family)
MPMKKRTINSKWIDPDDAPALDREWFERAEIWEGNKLIRPGRPGKAAPKETVSLRLDPDVLEHFHASGPGWQSRINAARARRPGCGRERTGCFPGVLLAAKAARE